MRNLADQLANAVMDGDAATVDPILTEDPALLSDADDARWLLRSASGNNHLAIVQRLVECGADIHSNDGDSPEGLIYDAARDGAVDVVRWMLERGAVVHHEFHGKRRCLSIIGAARSGSLPTVKLLVEHGAEFNLPWHGATALSVAEQNGHTEVAKYLRGIGGKRPDELTG